MRPVVFPHWFHRIRYRCKCHADLGFKFKAGGNEINMVKVIDGQFCGACQTARSRGASRTATCATRPSPARRRRCTRARPPRWSRPRRRQQLPRPRPLPPLRIRRREEVMKPRTSPPRSPPPLTWIAGLPAPRWTSPPARPPTKAAASPATAPACWARPRWGDAAAWKPRGNLATLVASAKAGKGAMPPKGGMPTLSDQQLENAIAYMLGQSSAAAPAARRPRPPPPRSPPPRRRRRLQARRAGAGSGRGCSGTGSAPAAAAAAGHTGSRSTRSRGSPHCRSAAGRRHR